ncbi:unnamed protein product, partial [Hymenolepis diminuta]
GAGTRLSFTGSHDSLSSPVPHLFLALSNPHRGFFNKIWRAHFPCSTFIVVVCCCYLSTPCRYSLQILLRTA